MRCYNVDICRRKVMDVKEVFRRLTSNQYIPGFNYRTSFSFQTVFYFSRHSYCCCECAFEHEYLEYILDSGGINEEMYNKTLENILNGKCHHVDKVDKDYIKKTSITAAHIAAALGTEQVVNTGIYRNHSYGIINGVFRLSLFQTAMLKQSTLCFNMLRPDADTRMGWNIMCYHRSRESRDTINIESVSPLVFCVRKQNRALLKGVLNAYLRYTDFDKALELTFKYNLKDMQEELLRHIQTPSYIQILECMAAAIVYDHPDVLKDLLDTNRGDYMYMPKSYFRIICTVMNRSECADTLNSYQSMLAVDSLFNKLYGLDLSPEDFGDFPGDIVSKLKARAYIQDWINKPRQFGRSPLHYCVAYRPQEVKFLLQLGADVNKVDAFGHTPLMSLLSNREPVGTFTEVRETVGMLLQENPAVILNKKAVELAIVLDEKSMKPKQFDRPPCAEFKMNAEIHSLVQSSNAVDESVLFLGPLLIECGFPVTRDVLYESLLKRLHSVEKVFIRRCLEMPRSLKLFCRDALRAHFPGRDLNHFLESREIPKSIKDFILLKYLF